MHDWRHLGALFWRHARAGAGISLYVAAIGVVVHGVERMNIMPPFCPRQFDDFVDLIVLILRRRSLFRERDDETTLREHLGLVRPGSRFAEAQATASSNRLLMSGDVRSRALLAGPAPAGAAAISAAAAAPPRSRGWP